MLYAVKLPDGTWKGDDLKGHLLSRKPGAYQISVTPIRDKTSDQQRRYYRGVILPMISQEAGYDDDSMHEVLIQELAPTIVIKSKLDKRRRKKFKKRTNDMDTAEFTQFIEKCRAFALSFYGINIPDPA
jgi:hypothetical protein